MEEFFATGWSNGGKTRGLRISPRDRDLYLKPEWCSVSLFIPEESEPVEIDITASMWKKCTELRHPKIGDWFERTHNFCWPKGRPPSVRFVPNGPRSFAVSFVQISN